jgi:hypothetical protein
MPEADRSGDSAMPNYYFDLYNGGAAPDLEGYDLPDDAAARDEALVFAGQTIMDQPHLVKGANGMRIQVLDARRRPVFLVVVLGIELTWKADGSGTA